MRSIACLARLVVTTSALFALACGSSGGSGGDDTEGALSVQDQSRAAGLKLAKELFENPESQRVAKFTLTGHLPSSTEPCQVNVSFKGVNPARSNWSMIAIHPLGRSGDTIEADGPVDMGFLFPPGASDSHEAISIESSQTVFTAKDAQNGEDMTLTLKFDGSPHKLAALKSASIHGMDSARRREDGECVELKAPFVLDPVEMQRIADRAKADYTREHPDDPELEGMEFEGCELTRPTRLSCGFGNETNEETLTFLFAVNGDQVGAVVNVERHSDFH